MPAKGQTKPASQMRSRYRKMRVNGKQVSVHRYVLEQKLGRALRPDEVSHHINGDRYDDHPENLEPMLVGEHSRLENLGKKLTPEHKAKVSASLIGNQRRKGIPTPPELREHLRQTSTAARKRKFWSSHKK